MNLNPEIYQGKDHQICSFDTLSFFFSLPTRYISPNFLTLSFFLQVLTRYRSSSGFHYVINLLVSSNLVAACNAYNVGKNRGTARGTEAGTVRGWKSRKLGLESSRNFFHLLAARTTRDYPGLRTTQDYGLPRTTPDYAGLPRSYPTS